MNLTRDEKDMLAEIDFREDVQREIDSLAVQDAYHEGLRAGTRGTSAGCNPWADPLSDEFKAWERGRRASEAQRLYRYLPKRAA